jgi:RND family efflux transporter MFP subunit
MKTKRLLLVMTVLAALVAAMGVRLVTIKRARDSELESIQRFAAVVPVEVEKVRSEPIGTTLTMVGTFQAASEVAVVSETQGRIKSVAVDVSDQVRRNQPLATVENDVAAAQLELARESYAKAERNLKRFALLSTEEAASVVQREEAGLAYFSAKTAYTTAQRQYDNSFITAPIRGVVTKRSVENGTFIAPGMPLFEIVDIETLKLVTHLTADEVTRVHRGDALSVKTDALPGQALGGTVRSITSKADPSKRYEVVIDVPNHDRRVSPGMYAAAELVRDGKEQRVLISRRAIAGSLREPEVFVVTGDTVHRRAIVALPLNETAVEVRDGLAMGDVVVVSGQINLKDGARVVVR